MSRWRGAFAGGPTRCEVFRGRSACFCQRRFASIGYIINIFLIQYCTQNKGCRRGRRRQHFSRNALSQPKARRSGMWRRARAIRRTACVLIFGCSGRGPRNIADRAKREILARRVIGAVPASPYDGQNLTLAAAERNAVDGDKRALARGELAFPFIIAWPLPERLC